MHAPTTLRKIATVRCVCNAGLHPCNGQMYLQPLVAPTSPVGARIARPFIPDVITPLREGARRVIGATAKPLYPIDGKAVGLDRRIPRPPSSREGDRRSGGRSKQTVEGVSDGGNRSPHSPENLARMLHMLHTLHMPKAYDVFLQRPSGVLPENVEIVGMVFHRINVF